MILFTEADVKELDDLGTNEEPEGGLEGTNEGYTPDMEGMMQIVFEAAEDWATLQEAIMYGDMVELVESYRPGGNAMLIQEANVTDFFEKVKAFFKKMWGHVTEFFKRFLDQLAAWLLNSKKFMEKYKNMFLTAANKLKKFDREGTDWVSFISMADNIKKIQTEVTSNSKNALKDVQEAISMIAAHGGKTDKSKVTFMRDKKDDFIKGLDESTEKFRGSLLGVSQKISDSNFASAIKYTIRNGGKYTTTEPKKIKWDAGKVKSKASFIAKELEEAADTKKAIQDAKKNMDDAFKTILKAIDEHKAKVASRGSLEGDSADLRSIMMSYFTICHNSFKKDMNSANKVCGALCSAITARNTEYKNLVVKVIAAVGHSNLKEDTDLDVDEDLDDVDDLDTDEKDNSDSIEPTQESAISRYLNKKRGY